MWSQSFFLLILFALVLAGRRGGGSHSYPHSTGYSGGGSHTYPHSTGYSGGGARGTHTYPQSTGISGNTHVQRTYTQHQNVNYGHKTEIHNHYHYNPPQQISYGSTYHPVYHAQPPIYVYEYRDSGSRFDNLLTGLALYNLGRMSASHNYDSRREYRPTSSEICKLGISKQNGEYEETRIDCKLMSSFIWEAESQPRNQQVVSTNTITTTVVQSTSNLSGTRINDGSSVVTTVTMQNKTVVDALHVKGPSIQVTQGMNCFMIRISRDSSILKKKVDCGLLQAYAQNSLQYRNGSEHLLSATLTTVFFFIMSFIIQ